MKFSINLHDLLTGLRVVEQAVDRNSTYPILRGFLLATDGADLTVVGTDLLTYAVWKVPGTFTNALPMMGVVVEYSILEMLNTLEPNGLDLIIEVKEDHLRVCHGANAYTFSTLPGGEFPVRPVITHKPRGIIINYPSVVQKFVNHEQLTMPEKAKEAANRALMSQNGTVTLTIGKHIAIIEGDCFAIIANL